jgi:site-specific recombinase XerC
VVRLLLADCSGRDFRNRRDCAIIRRFLDTGMRLESMSGLRYSPDDPELSDVDLKSHVARTIAKGRRELVLPIGQDRSRHKPVHPRACLSPALGQSVAVARQEGPTDVERRLSDDQGWA